jgi:hypothetical protein
MGTSTSAYWIANASFDVVVQLLYSSTCIAVSFLFPISGLHHGTREAFAIIITSTAVANPLLCYSLSHVIDNPVTAQVIVFAATFVLGHSQIYNPKTFLKHKFPGLLGGLAFFLLHLISGFSGGTNPSLLLASRAVLGACGWLPAFHVIAGSWDWGFGFWVWG